MDTGNPIIPAVYAGVAAVCQCIPGVSAQHGSCVTPTYECSPAAYDDSYGRRGNDRRLVGEERRGGGGGRGRRRQLT